MIQSKKIILPLLIGVSSFFIFACSTNIKKAYIPDTANPQEEITKMDADLAAASSENIDVLAPREFANSRKWLKEAKSDLGGQQKQDEILNDLRKSRGFLQEAQEISKGRAQNAPGLFEARQAARDAGAARHAELQDELESIDKEVSSKAATLADVDSEDISELQERYVTLERQATILTQLGSTQATFNGARKSGASKKAPQTYKRAELSLKNAESVISANVRNPRGYSAAVATAVEDTTLLDDVMNTIAQNGKGLSESAALKMVNQSRKIKALNSDISISAAESASIKSAMSEKNMALAAELKGKNQDLGAAKASVETQRAMDTARRQFSADEAEAYQQGGSLLIRLKKVNFPSGRAELPGDSLALLAKVSEVAQTMNTTKIKVEGHTDSVGSAELNKSLSEKRASAVATYFKSNGFEDVQAEGYGFQKPIATNKSKEGRAQNRRVDIILTPDNSTVSE